MHRSADAGTVAHAYGRAVTTTERTSGWTRPAYWIWTAAGVVPLFLAWMWFGLSFMEEMTEHCRALSAQTSMEGWGALLGLPPLLLAHAIGLLILVPVSLGSWTSRARAVLAAVCAVAIASVPGMLLAQWFWSGQLFTMGASAACCEL